MSEENKAVELNEEETEKVNGGFIDKNLVNQTLYHGNYYRGYCKYCDNYHDLRYLGMREDWNRARDAKLTFYVFHCEIKNADNYYYFNGELQ